MAEASSKIDGELSDYKYLSCIKKAIKETDESWIEPWEYNSLTDENSPSAADIIDYFGGWSVVFAKLDYNIPTRFNSNQLPNPPTEFEMRDFTKGIQRYYNENEELPKVEDIFDVNYFPSSDSYNDYFDSWSNAIRATGYIPPRSYTDEELLVILQKTSKKVDGAMSIKDYRSVRESHHPSEACYSDSFGGWRAAKEKFVMGEHPDKHDCIKEIGKVAEKIGSPPTKNQYQVHPASEFSVPVILHYFDCWNDALVKSGFSPSDTKRLNQRIQDFYDSTPWSIIRQNFKERSEDTIFCPFCNGTYGTIGDTVKHLQRSHNQIYQRALLDEIRYLKSRYEKIPSLQLLQSNAVFQRSAYEENYGSWNTAVEEAGFESFERPDISKESLIRDIQNVSEEHLNGDTPQTDDIDKYGKHHPETYRRYFDNKFWRALEEAGFEPTVRRNMSKDYLLDEIRRVAGIIDRTTPRVSDMKEHGKCVPSNYFENGDGSDYFDSWSEALIEAGFEPNARQDLNRNDIIEDFRSIAEEMGRIPTQREFSDRVNFSSSVAYNQFGGWNALIREAGYEPPHRKSIPDEELMNEIHILYEEKGRAPTMSEIVEEGKFSITGYKRAFGSWTEAVEEAGYEPINKPHGELHADWKPDSDNQYYGPNWRKQRAKCIGRDGRKCRVCGKTQHEMGCEPSVHHIRPRSTFENENYQEMNKLDNLIALCPSCHGKFEGKWRNSTPEEFENKAKDVFQEWDRN